MLQLPANKEINRAPGCGIRTVDDEIVFSSGNQDENVIPFSFVIVMFPFLGQDFENFESFFQKNLC